MTNLTTELETKLAENAQPDVTIAPNKEPATEATTSFNVESMRQAAEAASSLMKLMANPDRLLLLCQLAQTEKSVGELEALTGIQQPTLSQQLTVLREAKLVSTRREGKNIFYSIASGAAMNVMQVLYLEFCKS